MSGCFQSLHCQAADNGGRLYGVPHFCKCLEFTEHLSSSWLCICCATARRRHIQSFKGSPLALVSTCLEAILLICPMQPRCMLGTLSMDICRIQVPQAQTGHWMRHWVVANLFMFSRHFHKNGATCTCSSVTVQNVSNLPRVCMSYSQGWSVIHQSGCQARTWV